MKQELSAFARSAQVDEIAEIIDRQELLRDLGQAAETDSASRGLMRLRIAAFLEIGSALAAGVEKLLQSDREPEAFVGAFKRWDMYIRGLQQVDRSPEVEDLIMFSASGLLGDRPHEVRWALRLPFSRSAVLTEIEPSGAWFTRTKHMIGAAVLHLVSQDDHNDMKVGGALIDQLASEQRVFEEKWLSAQADPPKEAVSLLGLYHLAHAVKRTSEFLLTGSLEKDGRPVADVASELRRLLIKSEEYLAVSNRTDELLWLKCVSSILWRLREGSVWVQAKGISERLDRLVSELTRFGRQQPIFSLLPSQQDALRKNVLDPSKVAVVLQMPTSAGKTLLAEFSIIQSIVAYGEGTRIAYVVPTRALATQVRRTLTQDLKPLGVEVAAAGSAFEEDPFEINLLEKTDGVIVSTPEKLDLILRMHPDWFDKLRLVIIDEAHSLADSERGARLELLLANLRREHPKARLLLMTPFLENSKEIASWLGGDKAAPIDVSWRPSRIMLGLGKFEGRAPRRKMSIELKEPYAPLKKPMTLTVPTDRRAAEVLTGVDKVVAYADQFADIGTILAMFAGSRSLAEKAAIRFAELHAKPLLELSPELRLAIALARYDFGPDSPLATCLERGVAFHHSSLSPTLRFLIEDQVKAGGIRFISATSTLAQGMNFPVTLVLVHSVEKPNGGGKFTASEFWNIAGRAGRVGNADRGLVIFLDGEGKENWDFYSGHLSNVLVSALSALVKTSAAPTSLKKLYHDIPESRPFIQYLCHAATQSSPTEALANLEEILQGSLAARQLSTAEESRQLRQIAQAYLAEISSKNIGYLKVADQTGLGSFSFDELYARILQNDVLASGPGEVLNKGQDGMAALIDALQWIPELSLGLGFGSGPLDIQKVAEVVDGWINGKSIHELSRIFPDREADARLRHAGQYIYSKVSQTISWGAHAYLRGWLLKHGTATEDGSMLATYIQYGVRSPEAAIASLMNLPRPFAEAAGAAFRKSHAALTPERAKEMKAFTEAANLGVWESIVRESALPEVNPADLRRVWRNIQGLSAE